MPGENNTNENFYRFNDLTVDGENFRVRKDGRGITLTPRAFDVLIFLLRNGGRVVEKQEIFDAVWKDTFVGDNALTKIIKEIRQALDDDASQPRYIETVPKRGYRFIAAMKTESETPVENAKPDEDSKPVEDSKIENSEIENSAETIAPPLSRRKKLLPLAAAVLGLIILAAGFLAFSEWRSEMAARNAPIDSIAVLPFENETQDQNIEYLSDGLTENIINTLSRLPNLRVLPRSTVFYYKNKPEDPHTIGRILRVRAVLTGKVVQRADRLNIQIELIDVDRKAQIWGQQYNRPFADVISLQEEIADTIAERLRFRLNGTEQKQLNERWTANPEAFRLYLKGRFFLNKRTEEDIRKSVEYFNQAIELDPNYAQAHAGIADAYITLSAGFTTEPTSDLLLAARTAALKALSIDDALVEARVLLATLKERYEWDFIAAENEYRRAIELNPDYAAAHHRFGLFLWAMGRHEEADAELGRARELDPISAIILADSGLPFYSTGRQEKAIEYFKKALEIEPDFKLAHYYMARSLALLGRNDEAVAEARKSFAPVEPVRPDGTKKINGLLAIVYAMTGRRKESRAILAEMEKQPAYIIPYNQAAVYAALGEKEQAFAALEKAYRERAGGLVQLKINPVFDNLRNDARYTDLIRRVGLPP